MIIIAHIMISTISRRVDDCRANWSRLSAEEKNKLTEIYR